MKKAKLMLAVIATVAVVGGAFAFKAAKFTPLTLFAYTSSNTSGIGLDGAAGCFDPKSAGLATTQNGNIPTSLGYGTTFITNSADFCVTKTRSAAGE